jgi:phage shock protein C
MTKAKRLSRATEKKLVAGVLAGFADYFDQDPTLFRLAAILFLLVTGVVPAVLFYLVAWVIIPAKRISPVDYDR